ncbi:dihydrofolate reductase family protein [Leptothoe sp. ISB3NOV94-8A]|uniref:Dihydrofolate reductase n=1 Tax=Adonisia turfae CCMR0081 TaxID=2292702 RepID=A0A6M0RTF5_9CYAN|nr:dihydrofolate reductase family protein [Adonisia turfae]MDV3347197.1 dihydrofolate reductase family protein [Leptothoe sp. LEGE 181152]NEZ59043.1 dihydrofolate reductase [Adonisia turfae CCMR0081]
MANYVYIATSLDGFIATPDGGVDWLDDIPNPDQSDFGYGEFIKRVDAILMGRNSFEKVLSFGTWPYEKLVFVLSNRLKHVPDNLVDSVEIVSGNDLKTLVGQLDKRGYHNLYIDGGRTIQSFLAEDMIDEMIITRVPVLLGDGIPLFDKLINKLQFRHNKTELFNNMLVKSAYSRIRA